MDTSTMVMMAVALLLLVAAYLRAPELAQKGLGASVSLVLEILPRMAEAFLIAGLIQVLVSEEVIAHWIGISIGPLVSYLTAWSLLGLQRIIMWEIPFLGMKVVLVRIAASFLFPLFAGWFSELLWSKWTEWHP